MTTIRPSITRITYTNAWSLFLGALLLFPIAANADFTVCTTCATNAPMLVKDNPICDPFIKGTNGLFDTDKDCRDLQLGAYQAGCCPNPPFEHCEYCEDGATPILDNTIPTGQFVGGEACYDYIYQNQAYFGLFEDGKCEDTFLQRAGFYCGCPNQRQECWLCPDKQPPSRPAKGDAWVTDATCRGIEYYFSLMKEDECSSFPILSGADLAIFCGCGGLNQTKIDVEAESFTCNLCRNGGKVRNPDQIYTTNGTFYKTCGQAEEFARDVIKTPSGCKNVGYFGEAWENCKCTEGPGQSSSSSSSGPSTTKTKPLWVAILVGMASLATLFYH